MKIVDSLLYYLDYIVKYVLSPLLPDKLYLKIRGLIRCGYVFNFKRPNTFNEKMNWLKLYDRRDIYTLMVDKIAVKQFVSNIIGEEYVVPLIGVYDSPLEIQFDKLPNKCILKTNQDSGGAIIWDKSCSSIQDVLTKLSRRNKNFYLISREWPYKNVKTKYFIEQLLDSGNEQSILYDYKFWCFNGMPKYVYITCKSSQIFENFYDMDFNPVMIEHGSPRITPEFRRPKDFDLMKKLATRLANSIPFVRVDFFYVQGKIYFSEFTFYDWGGLKPFKNGWDLKLGDCLKLPSYRCK